jgi:general secretion pathway protein I
MMIRRPAARRGLSLIEVLLALVILVTSLAAIGQLVDLGTWRATDAQANTRGTRLAQAKMGEIEAGLIPVNTETTGNFDGDDAGWSFTVSWESAGPPNLYTATVKVSATTQGRTNEITLTQMIFDPSLTGSAAQAERPPAPDPTTTGGTSP